MDYREFLRRKHIRSERVGFKPKNLNRFLKDWQTVVTEWACEVGRAGMFEDCGLGKTIQQLAWGEQIVRKENKPVILFCPLAVGFQTVAEAERFGINDVRTVQDSSEVKTGINVTNYERLHKFDMSQFAGVILDESSILKSYTGTTKQRLVNECRDIRYKLACTATPSPNDQMELGNHAEFLGVMRSSEMLARWFINDGKQVGKYTILPHGAEDYWRWVASWSVCLGRPSDIGYSDEGYILPPLTVHEHIVEDNIPDPGSLFPGEGKLSATSVHKEKRKLLLDRCKTVADLVNSDTDQWAVWCDTDYEADQLKTLIDCVEVRGSHNATERESRFRAFMDGTARVIVTKPEIGGFGLNWQHCHKTTWFAGYSYERYYQSVRRLYRFGQTKPVDVHLVMTEMEASVAEAIRRKEAIHNEMRSEMAIAMKEGMQEELSGQRILRSSEGSNLVSVPSFMEGFSVCN